MLPPVTVVIAEEGGLRALVVLDGGARLPGERHRAGVAQDPRGAALPEGERPVVAVVRHTEQDLARGHHRHRVIEHLPHPVDRRDSHRRAVGVAPLVGHQHHIVRRAAVGGVIMRGVQEPLLIAAYLRREGRHQQAAETVQPVGQLLEEAVVGLAVIGEDVLKIEVQSVVSALGERAFEVFEKAPLRRLVPEDRVGDIPGKAAARALVGHGEQPRRVVILRGCVVERIVFGQPALRVGAPAERREKAQVGQLRLQ